MRLNAADPAAFATALGSSFERHGFAVVADHGIGKDVSAAALADAKTFFALPEATKVRYRIPGGGGHTRHD